MKLTIQNFRCFKYREFDFPDSNLSLLKGESGRGKSSLLESCRWCLYGNLRNIYPLNFKPSSSNQTMVMLEFPNQKLCKIIRSSPPEQLKVFIKKDDSEECDILESEAAQRYIETVFSSKDIWIASSYIAQGERSPLMTYSNSEKTNLLCSILFGDKFNSDVNTYDNPDFYSTKIDGELNEVSTKLAVQTSSFNSLYTKYMELINTYKPKENPYWKALPNKEAIEELESKISNLRLSIYDITKEMVEASSKEKEKEMLNERLASLSAKIKLFESMNSDDLVKYLQETREEISSLETSIQEMNTLYLSTLAKEQKKEFLQKNLDEYSSLIDNFSEETKSGNLNSIEEEITSKNSSKKSFEVESMKVKMLESEKERLTSKLKTLQEGLVSIQASLQKYPIQDIDLLRSLIQNTKSFQKLKDIQEKEPEDINILYENEISEMLRSLPVFISEYNQNYKIALHYKILQENQPITEQTEQAIAQHLTSSKKVLDFVEIMKKELEHKERLSQIEKKLSVISSDIETLKNSILENEKEISSVPILNLETYITMKTEIQMNTGDCLQCPDCNSSLEFSGNKLCKLTKQRYSKEDSKKRIDLLNKLSESLRTLKSKESELEYLQKEKEALPVPKAEYTSEQVVNAYNDAVIEKYKSFFEGLSKFKNGVKNNYANSSSEAEELLRKIPLYQKRKAWEKEFEQAKQTFSIDESLEILTSEKMSEYERTIIELPMFQSREKQYQDSINETSESLSKTLAELSKFSNSSSDLEVLLQTINKAIQNLESSKIKIVEYNKVKTNYESTVEELSKIVIQSGSENIKESLESLKTKVQNLKETLSGYSQYEVITQEYRDVENKLNVLNKTFLTSSQELSNTLEETNKLINSYEDYVLEGKTLLLMVTTRSELEVAQKSMLELTNQQSHLNRLRMLIIEVTNSSLQNLVDSINACTNSILEDLFENDIKLELKLFKEDKKTNNLKPRINFAIYYNNNTYDSIMGLSGGEKDRISLALTIALACVNPSPVLFLDECLGTIGNDTREYCIEALKKYVISNTKKKVIIVEHNMIEGFADHIIEI